MCRFIVGYPWVSSSGEVEQESLSECHTLDACLFTVLRVRLPRNRWAEGRQWAFADTEIIGAVRRWGLRVHSCGRVLARRISRGHCLSFWRRICLARPRPRDSRWAGRARDVRGGRVWRAASFLARAAGWFCWFCPSTHGGVVGRGNGWGNLL